MTAISPDPGSPEWFDMVDARYKAELDRRDYERYREAEEMDAYYAALDSQPVERIAEFNVDDRNQDHEEDNDHREGRR